MNVLVVEDETALRESIIDYLKRQDFTCQGATTFQEAREHIENSDYDCIVLDITLPEGNGLDILKQLKSDSKPEGVIIISAKNALDDRVTGLTLGADDYLTKPFHLSELSARIAAVIRRKSFGGNNIISIRDIFIDALQQQVKILNNEVLLTKKEYDLLLYFVSNSKRVITKEAIARHLWGEEMGGNYDFIYTHIKNLRRKLQDAGGKDYIQSVYGFGYKFPDQ